MKLNLLPTYVSKGKQAATAWIVSALLMLLSIGAAIGMIIYSRGLKDKMTEVVAARQPEYDKVKARAAMADQIIADGRPVMIVTALAESMDAHNAKYPDLYDEVLNFVPSFYRVNTVSATPAGPNVTTVTMSGYLQTQQQYSDLMLALMRIPGAQTVGRAGYVPTAPRVPALTEVDQVGRALRPDQGPVPTDPQERLNYYIAQGSVSGFENVGGFGATDSRQRGAMPGYSTVNVSVVLNRDLMVPDHRGTLAGIAPITGSPQLTPAGTPPAPGTNPGNAPGPGPGPGGRGPGGGADDR